MKITKVELLWSRDCPFKCSGCAMPTPLQNPGAVPTVHGGTLDEWKRGVQRMRHLGSQFVAIYGAEPTTRMQLLPDVVQAIYDAGMKCTVITALPTSPQMAQLLRAAPVLDSLTVSYDEAFLDAHRKAKSMAGWAALTKLTHLRDRACVATITKHNAHLAGKMARRAHDAGFWFLFDLLHVGHGALSKCTPGTGSEQASAEQVREMCDDLLSLKGQGLRVHASAAYLQHLRATYQGDARKVWHCRGPVTGWITVDADGAVMPCDDWQTKFPGGLIWDDGWTADELAQWKARSVEGCPGCAWNTHFDAVEIERGADVGTYVH